MTQIDCFITGVAVGLHVSVLMRFVAEALIKWKRGVR